jgi:hypothetical protein
MLSRSAEPSGQQLTFLQFLVGVFASFGSALFGYDLGVIAEVIGSSSYEKLFNVDPASPETFVHPPHILFSERSS